MPPAAAQRSFALLLILTVSVTTAWTALLVTGYGGATMSQAVSNIGLCAASVAASLGCAIAARRGDRFRRVWIFLSAATIAWGIGQIIWASYESSGREVPFPSLADVGYLAMFPLAAVSFFLLPTASQTLAGRLRTIIDGLMIAGSVLLMSWVLVLGAVFEAGGEGLLPQIISLAYPLGDVVLITIILYVLLRRDQSRQQEFPIRMIAFGFVAFAVADSGFTYQTASGAYGSGSLIDIGWFLCFALILVAALRPTREDTIRLRTEDEGDRTFGLLLPYAAVFLALLTSSFDFLTSGATDPIVHWIRTFIIVSLVARQVLTLLENSSLTQNLRSRVVALRASEQRFQALVQHSSDVVTVIDADAHVIYQSESAERVFGYSPAAILGQPVVSILGESSRDHFAHEVETLRSEPYGISVLELEVRHQNGNARQAEVTITNLLDNPDVRGIVLNTRDVSERKELEEQLVHSAFHDSLTTLANRALFRDRVDETIQSSEGGLGVAVLFLDLDGFKQVNDLLGHASGDLLLVMVAERLRASVRPTDMVARLGGDEFAVLLENADDATAVEIARRITAALREPFEVDGHEILVRGSLGLAIASMDVRDADRLLRNADLAMYRSKSAGKGEFERYDPDMHVVLVERLQLEADLRRALDAEELVLHYQPIVTLATGEIVGVEALVRWRHPTRGLIAPTAFIPLAEESGLISILGRWVLMEACRQAAEWESPEGVDPLTMSVNISAWQLRDGFVKDVADALERSGLPGKRLVLEMTESVLMEHTEENLERFTKLRTLGVRFAIDDFGTGYSSLSYLHRFPIDILKIDRSFIELLGKDNPDPALVRTIVRLGQSLRMRTIAEGIETASQLAALQELECELGQGYHFGRPVTAKQLERLLTTTVRKTSRTPTRTRKSVGAKEAA